MDNRLQSNDLNETIVYRKLRSPGGHGESLQIPPLDSVDQFWRGNLQTRAAGARLNLNSAHLRPTQNDGPGGIAILGDLQKTARAEIVELAASYSGGYLDVGQAIDPDTIVMAGHQPGLFHPGVWYKNFVLSNLGKRFRSVAINLVVDNDICGAASIRFPNVEQPGGQRTVTLGTIQFDQPGRNEPFEAREIVDQRFFEQFPKRVESALGSFGESPIVNRLWPHVIQAKQTIGNRCRLGQAIAAGRHRLEQEVGLRTLEVPISQMTTMSSFAAFAGLILGDARRFCEIYNQVLLDYRDVHRIRSRSHPVPQLEELDGWIEVPFWVWQRDNPERKRLFTKQAAQQILLSDRAGWEAKLDRAEFTTQFRSLGENGVAIRPKALMTTMFARLLLCDLFLHGIGGAKYDQLTDVIAAKFFAVRLPGYLTLSATMQLPTKFDLVNRSDVVAIERRIRHLRFHPETLLENPSAELNDLIAQKLAWTKGQHWGENSKQQHLAITALNEKIAGHCDVTVEQLRSAREHVERNLRSSEILGSREYSFCLFPESLIDELKSLSTIECR